MAGGWTRDGAVQDQIDDTVKDAILGARARMPAGPGETHCVECGEAIPEGRRRARCRGCALACPARPSSTAGRARR